MNTLEEYISQLNDENKKNRVLKLIDWIKNNFQDLKLEIKWNQPMFIHHGTYIIGMSVSKNHLSIGLEARSMERLVKIIESSEYEHSKMLIKIKWSQEIDYDFLRNITSDIIVDKKDVKTFWY
jgi:uncharacterized protein YdhG (YjbR/CyaY superfamily)